MITASTNTSAVSGSIDITTTDLGGVTPKAALVLCSRAIAEGTEAADAASSIGFVADNGGTPAARCISSIDVDGETTSDSSNRAYNDGSIIVIMDDAAEGPTDGVASFTSFITNGIRINFTEAPGSAWLIEVLFFAGDDVEAHCLDDTVLFGSNDHTEPGFRPSFILTASCTSDFDETRRASYIAGFGIGVDPGDSGDADQRGITHQSNDGVGTSEVRLDMRDDRCVFNSGGSVGIKWTAFDANGATAQAIPTVGVDYMAMFIKCDNEVAILDDDTPTLGATQNVTGFGFDVEAAIIVSGSVVTMNTLEEDGDADSFCIGWMPSEGSPLGLDQKYTRWEMRDGQGTTDTKQLSKNSNIIRIDAANVLKAEAAITTLISDGFTLTYGTTSSPARLFFVLGIGPEPVTVPPKMMSYRRRRVT